MERSFISNYSEGQPVMENFMASRVPDRRARAVENDSPVYVRVRAENNVMAKQDCGFAEFIGSGPGMDQVFHLISQVAGSNSTVLVLGETGTGKELVAKAIHNNSSRKNKTMVKVNCAALPANLVESELFGHERGSFTGAVERRIGKFELAHNSTLFLDEIGEMPADLQVKLLRALQEREFERVGGTTTIKVDVRIIVATNRDLKKEVREGRFRSDLYYRLNVFPITIPPLRERMDNIDKLADFFVQRFAKSLGRDISHISFQARKELQMYSWPGNVRELEHLIERSVLMCTDNVLRKICMADLEYADPYMTPVSGNTKTISENERDHIVQVIRKCGGKISGKGGAADLLGVPPSTLNSKIARLGITRQQRFSS
ncbi:MAG: sigma 54-interacting transcriptional regulator [Chitinophagaceae bacterium]